MLLAIDAGNTNTVFAVFEGDTLLRTWRLETRRGGTSDSYGAFLLPLLDLAGISAKSISYVLVSSVVPETTRPLKIFSRTYLDIDPVFITKDNVGVEISLERSGDVGADRLVNAVAVKQFYQAPAIVIDFGTATTFDVLEDGFVYAGGVIAPGVNLSISALAHAASKLPKIDVEKPRAVLGTSTVHAMQSGVYWGYVGLINGILDGLENEMSAKPVVIATGGLAALFEHDVPRIDVIDADITIKGMQKIYESIGR